MKSVLGLYTKYTKQHSRIASRGEGVIHYFFSSTSPASISSFSSTINGGGKLIVYAFNSFSNKYPRKKMKASCLIQ